MKLSDLNIEWRNKLVLQTQEELNAFVSDNPEFILEENEFSFTGTFVVAHSRSQLINVEIFPIIKSIKISGRELSEVRYRAKFRAKKSLFLFDYTKKPDSFKRKGTSFTPIESDFESTPQAALTSLLTRLQTLKPHYFNQNQMMTLEQQVLFRKKSQEKTNFNSSSSKTIEEPDDDEDDDDENES